MDSAKDKAKISGAVSWVEVANEDDSLTLST